MRNQNLGKEIEKTKHYLVIVEGEKDKLALKQLGFNKIFVLNETGKSLYEKIEQIELLAGKTKICILTDFDKKGKKLYLLIKAELAKRRVKLDNTFRGKLLKLNISHIEGLSTFLKNFQGNEKKNRKHR
jgi:5S rRNA maturation endonuclease (ribonuclease M5)